MISRDGDSMFLLMEVGSDTHQVTQTAFCEVSIRTLWFMVSKTVLMSNRSRTTPVRLPTNLIMLSCTLRGAISVLQYCLYMYAACSGSARLLRWRWVTSRAATIFSVNFEVNVCRYPYAQSVLSPSIAFITPKTLYNKMVDLRISSYKCV